VELDAEYFASRSLGFDIAILILTLRKAFTGRDVRH
jgi:lipopolysaccharide/colanic/teichoic acid biosynthesis glycosyltransferase